MGAYCCKSEEGPQEITEQTDYNQNNQNNNEDMFITRPPCWYKHQCSCPCHTGKGECIFKKRGALTRRCPRHSDGGSCIFKIQSK